MKDSLDGFSVDFFHKNWDIVGNDVIQAVKLFFGTGFLTRQWKYKVLTLVPKVASPTLLEITDPLLVAMWSINV